MKLKALTFKIIKKYYKNVDKLDYKYRRSWTIPSRRQLKLFEIPLGKYELIARSEFKIKLNAFL